MVNMGDLSPNGLLTRVRAACMVVSMTTEPDDIRHLIAQVRRRGRAVARARQFEQDALSALGDAVRAAATGKVSEVELAGHAGINRTTIRRMLGKGK